MSTKKPRSKQSRRSESTLSNLVRLAGQFSSSKRKASRYVTTESKAIKRTAKSVGRSASKIVAAIQKRRTVAKKQKALRNRKSYSVRDLPVKQTGGMIDVLKRIESDWENIDKLKEPLVIRDKRRVSGEYWAAKINNYGTYKVYEDIGLLIDDLMKYDEVVRYGSKRGKALDYLIDEIKIVKFKGTSQQYRKEKLKEVAFREEKKKRLAKELSEKKKEIRKTKSESKQAKKALAKKQKKINQLTRKLDATKRVIEKMKQQKKKKRGGKK